MPKGHQTPPRVSFEFFPPKTEKLEEQLWASIARLAPLNPSFVSVTYGAGGSTRDRTHRTVARIASETHLKPAAHLTCVAASRDDVHEVLREYWDAGVRHIVALRGDPQTGVGTPFVAHPDGYASSADLVEGVKKIADFEVSVGAYPELHPEAVGPDSDVEMLKRKMGAGADRAITNTFFDPAHFLRFRDAAAKAGITIPIVPGIMPIANAKNNFGFARKTGVTVPPELVDLFDGLEEDPETAKLVAATVASDMCQTLRAEGVDDFHFYTLNKADLTLGVCRLLGVRAQKTGEA